MWTNNNLFLQGNQLSLQHIRLRRQISDRGHSIANFKLKGNDGLI